MWILEIINQIRDNWNAVGADDTFSGVRITRTANSDYKSSHTGSMITGDGLVNVQAGELVVRKDISDNLIRAAQMMEQAPQLLAQLQAQAKGTGITSRTGADI